MATGGNGHKGNGHIGMNELLEMDWHEFNHRGVPHLHHHPDPLQALDEIRALETSFQRDIHVLVSQGESTQQYMGLIGRCMSIQAALRIAIKHQNHNGKQVPPPTPTRSLQKACSTGF